MTASTRKAVGDAWQERARSGFVVAAIALGVAAFLALLASYAILTRELHSGYLATNPASAILHTDAVDDHMLAAVGADPEVGSAEAKRMVFGRIEVGPAQWRNLLLFVVSDYGSIRLNKIVPEQGAWPPATGEMLIERDAVQVAHARIGQTFVVRTADRQEHTLRISGRVHDVGQAQARMENSVYGYITPRTLAQLGQKPVLDLLYIQVATNKYDEAHIRHVAEKVKQRLEAEGYRIHGVDVPVPGKHPHADLMGTLLLAMFSFGVLLLALSGVLALNFTAALMAAQVRQIGIMKALGGTRGQVARIYLLQALLLGGVATVIGAPVGIWGTLLLCRYMGMFLNFDVTSFGIPGWVFVLAAMVGLGVPVIASAFPVWRRTSMSVRLALANTGTPQDHFGRSVVDRMLAGIGGGVRPVILSVRNSFRRRTRLVLTCTTLTCAGLLFMTALNLRTSMIRTFDRLFAAQKYELTVNFGEMYPVEKINRAILSVPGVIRSENWIVTQAVIARTGRRAPRVTDASDTFRVFALPADSKLFVPVLAKGRSLRSGEDDGILLNQTLAAQNPQIKVGDHLMLQMGSAEMKGRVVGVDREPMAPPPIAYVPISVLERVHPGMANFTGIAIKKTESASIESMRNAIDSNLEREGIRGVGISSKSEFRVAVDQHMLMIYIFLVLASCVVAGVGGLGLATTMGINVLERRREIGILRAIGATSRMIAAIVVLEAVVIAVLSWGAAVLLARPLSEALAGMMGRSMHGAFDFSVAPLGILVCLTAALLVAATASLLPAASALRLSVREALTYE
ncbi:MAG: FtsX-like permease family protein [Acidobacteriaceae bacterium]|nr:FtsX-like permease family protein [Acidobacteriaceae bacterium]